MSAGGVDTDAGREGGADADAEPVGGADAVEGVIASTVGLRTGRVRTASTVILERIAMAKWVAEEKAKKAAEVASRKRRRV